MKNSGNLLAQTVKREVELSEELMTESLKHSVRAGEFLEELKKLIPESSFESWLSKNCNLSMKEAQKLINFSSGEEITFSAYRVVQSIEHSTRREKEAEREV